MIERAEGVVSVATSVGSLEAPLTAAGNFLAGVTARTRTLARTSEAPAEACEQLLDGIYAAIEQLTRASTIARAMIAEGLPDAPP